MMTTEITFTKSCLRPTSDPLILAVASTCTLYFKLILYVLDLILQFVPTSSALKLSIYTKQHQ